ncbi:MAG: hypothetical protein QOD83_2672 [Solirubrobacteraceae bacterium]|jgi:hypothetical protein|nr:hypothetical protein [Solirubrobacteraceae bacterium]
MPTPRVQYVRSANAYLAYQDQVIGAAAVDVLFA